jgi:hypothetical protein
LSIVDFAHNYGAAVQHSWPASPYCKSRSRITFAEVE